MNRPIQKYRKTNRWLSAPPCIIYSGWNAPNSVTDCERAYLKALARFGILFPESKYLRKHWLNRSHKGNRQISGMATFLYQNCWVHEWPSYLFGSLSGSRNSPLNTKQNDHKRSWNTFTMLVNTSPTKVRKNVGDTNGALMTCFMAIQSGFLVFQGNIKHLLKKKTSCT